jgi:hypothetical protein
MNQPTDPNDKDVKELVAAGLTKQEAEYLLEDLDDDERSAARLAEVLPTTSPEVLTDPNDDVFDTHGPAWEDPNP